MLKGQHLVRFGFDLIVLDVDTDKKGEKVQVTEVKGVKMGSLVLGNKATAPGAELDPETARYRRGWKIEVDKISRFNQEIQEAEVIWDEVKNFDYQDMKAKAIEKARKKEGSQMQGLKSESNKKQLHAAKNVLQNR